MGHSSDTPSPLGSGRPSLRKSIGGLGFFSLAFGSMIGVGWVTAMGGWLRDAGPGGAMIAFAAGGVLMLFIGLCYAELTAMMPVAGGEVAYAYRSSGVGASFLVGWFLAFGYLSVSAFEAISVGTVLAYLFPAVDFLPLYEVAGVPVYAGHLILAVLFTGFITGVNYVGVRWAAGLQTGLTATFLAVTLVFVAAGIFGGSGGAGQPSFSRTGFGPILGGIAAVFVTVPFWFVGFDTIPQGAEEAETSVSPRRLGALILTSIVGATLFYLLVILAVSRAAPWTEITESTLPTAEAFSGAFGSRIMVNLVLTATVLGLLTSWNGFFLAGTRVLFALGRGRIVPPWLGRSHPRFETPGNAVLLAGAVTLAGALMGRGAMLPFVDVGSFCIAVAFVGVSWSTLKLRRSEPNAARPYRIPGGRIVPSLALVGAVFVLGVMVIPGSPGMLTWPLEWVILGAFVLLGGILWNRGRGRREATTSEERRRLILGPAAGEGAPTAGAVAVDGASRSADRTPGGS
ncbi:MAG: APC family permease [Longimicrobiales bacterium]|nr:APC family permease [Longimicrobiales bacterium]